VPCVAQNRRFSATDPATQLPLAAVKGRTGEVSANDTLFLTNEVNTF
jgi:hypothetical protein